MAEGAPLGVLSCEANGYAIGENRRKRERLRLPPVDGSFLLQRCSAALEETIQSRIELEVWRELEQCLVQLNEAIERDRSCDLAAVGAVGGRFGHLAQRLLSGRSTQCILEPLPNGPDHSLDLCMPDDTLALQLLCP